MTVEQFGALVCAVLVVAVAAVMTATAQASADAYVNGHTGRSVMLGVLVILQVAAMAGLVIAAAELGNLV